MKTRSFGFWLFSLWGLAGYSPGQEPLGAYFVERGDSLWKIAGRESVYQNSWQWPLLFEANRGLISNPDLIEPGWRLGIPLFPSSERIEKALAAARLYGEAVALSLAPPALAADPQPGLRRLPPILPFGEGGAMVLKAALLMGLMSAGVLVLAFLGAVMKMMRENGRRMKAPEVQAPAAPAAPLEAAEPNEEEKLEAA